MKTFKKIICILTFFISFSVYSQTRDEVFKLVYPVIDITKYPPSKIDCKKENPKTGFNYIKNNGFKADIDVNETNPFAVNRVPYWVETHGTPARNNFINPPTTPPTGFSNYASMYSWSDKDKIYSEGIAQVIPILKKGSKYNMSFFKKLADLNHAADNNMDKFLIVLMHCSDYEKIHTYPNYNIAALPGSSQIIYTENNLKNPEWLDVYNKFTAEDDYDMVWVFPQQKRDITTLLGVDFTGLVITDQQAISPCNIPMPLSGCNHIPNNTFEYIIPDPTHPLYHGAFAVDLIPDWQDTHGTCDINCWIPGPPIPNVNVAEMGVVAYPNNIPPAQSEGLCAKITPLVMGRKYTFSFYISSYTYVNSITQQSWPVTNVVFRAALIKCQQFPQNGPYIPPPLSIPNQVIYCEDLGVVDNQPWRHVVLTFVAADDYDMIRLYPEQYSPTIIPDVHESFVGFGFPELIENVDAGDNPPAQPIGNCTLTIGPATPNCAVSDAYFQWVDPAGNIHPTNPNQQIIVDESDPSQVGTWTLQMMVDNLPPPHGTLCSPIQSVPVSSSIIVPACGTGGLWPKVYSYSRIASHFAKDNHGNFFVNYDGAGQLIQNINHVGPMPPSQGHYLAHYTTDGVTNWINTTGGISSEVFALQSNDIRIGNNYGSGINQYVNAVTGNPSTIPIGFPQNEVIIAEFGSGYITRTSTSVNIYPAGLGLNTIPISGQVDARFNPTTNTLYIADYIGSQSTYIVFYVYTVSNNSFNFVAGNIIPASYNTAGLVQVTNSDKVYFIKDNQLQEYNYAANSFTAMNTTLNNTIPNFTNSDLTAVQTEFRYAEDNCLLFNYADNYLYAIDLAALTERKILTNNFPPPINGYGPLYNFYYAFYGADVYLAGCTKSGGSGSNNITIGNQLIDADAVIPYKHSVFFTKFNLLTDFTARPFVAGNNLHQPFEQKVDIFPNPASGMITVRAKEPLNEITIISSNGIIVRRVKVNGTRIVTMNINSFTTGIYYLKILSKTGIENRKIFINN